MGHNLMPIKVKVDPLIRTSPFATAQNVAIKGAGCRKIMHRKGKVKGLSNGVGRHEALLLNASDPFTQAETASVANAARTNRAAFAQPYSAASATAQYFSSGMRPCGSSAGLVSRLAAASA